MNILKNIRVLYSMDKIQKNNIAENDYAIYYDKFIDELDSLVNSNDLILAYKQLSYIKIELICLKEFWKVECDFRLFYLTKSIYILDIHIKMINWKIPEVLSKSKNNFIDNSVKWTGSVTELVELGYALIESKRINNGKIKIKCFMSQLSSFLNFKISDCFNIFREIRKRKYERTTFLNELKEGLIRRIDNIDSLS